MAWSPKAPIRFGFLCAKPSAIDLSRKRSEERRSARPDSVSFDRISALHGVTNGAEAIAGSGLKSIDTALDPTADLAQFFLRLANLPSYPLDRLSRYEGILWRQVGQILFALDSWDRHKPQDRRSRFHIGRRQVLTVDGRDD